MDSDKFPERLNLRRYDGIEPVLEFGPIQDDVWQCRPYHLVPVPLDNPGFNRDSVLDKIVEQKPNDIYVFAHGWHRNLYLAMQVYDRLIGRFVMLRLGGSIPIDIAKSAFIGLAWNSDPTLESLGFQDPLGRRDKAEFLRNTEQHFEASLEPTFRMDMLLVYEWLAYYAGVSASPDRMIKDIPYKDDKDSPWIRINNYSVIVGEKKPATKPNISWEERCILLWKCYHEATPIGVNNDQLEEPHATSKFWEPFVTLFNFVLMATGGVAFVSSLLGIEPVKVFLKSKAIMAEDFILSVIGRPPNDPYGLVYVGLIIFLVSLVGLFGRTRISSSRSAGWAPVSVLGYLIVQVVLALPALVFLLMTYLFRGLSIPVGILMLLFKPVIVNQVDPAQWHYAAGFLILMGLGWLVFSTITDRPPRVFSEDIKKTGDDPLSIGEYLASLATLPCEWIGKILRPGHVIRTLARTLENQLAFFKMQRKAVKIGDQAAEFVSRIQEELPHAKIHLIGHSFGGSVVMNLARGLELRAADAKREFPVENLVTISGAYAANWPITKLANQGENVKGRIACLYSVNDSANMFYYPFGNAGRMSAGYVGHVVPKSQGKDGTLKPLVWKMTAAGSAAVIKPFVLMDREDPKVKDTHKFANVDISRLAFKGSFALGKGHDDIFHSDIVNIVWSILQT